MGKNKIMAGYETAKTDLGWVFIGFIGERIYRLGFGYSSQTKLLNMFCEWVDSCEERAAPYDLMKRIEAYALGGRDTFADVKINLGGATPFRKKVLQQCRKIPYGTTMSYGELAAKAGSPRAARAVGCCMSGNSIPLIIPCHRVVGHDGRLGAFSAPGGCKMKQRLIDLERQR